ncbi:MAG: PilZ domain-containing protein [Acidobacteriota bacterium]
MKQGQQVIIFSERKSGEEVLATVQTAHEGIIALEVSKSASHSPFEQGEQVEFQHLDEQFTLHCWQATIESITISEKDREQITASLSENEATVQRRSSYRFHLEIPISLIAVAAGSAELVGQRIIEVTNDISVGGLGFTTRIPLQIGDKLSCRLDLPEAQPVSCIGSVTRVEVIQCEGEDVNLIGLQFLALQNSHQVRLIQFLVQHKPES